jgi:Spy/CpxP family protein refolding chaperone
VTTRTKSWPAMVWAGMALLMLLALPVMVSAQDQPKKRQGGFGGGGGFGNRGGKLLLLGIEAVQKELDLNDEQKTSLKGLGEESKKAASEIYSGFRDLSKEDRESKGPELQKKVAEKTKEIEVKANELLLAAQRERLEQISLQQRGLGALVEDDIVKKLGISDDQKQKITAAREASSAKMREAFQGAGKEDREKAREKFAELRKDAEDDVLEILTSEQKASFEKLKGAKFEMPQGAGFGGFGGGGGFGKGKRPEKKAE